MTRIQMKRAFVDPAEGFGLRHSSPAVLGYPFCGTAVRELATFENHGILRRFLGVFAKDANWHVGNLHSEFGNLGRIASEQ
jgi:hypothetical protein